MQNKVYNFTPTGKAIPPHRNFKIMAFLSVVLVAMDQSANATTVALNPFFISEIRPANASEILQFSTAVTVVEFQDLVYNSPVKRKAYTATAYATVVAAAAAAQSGVLGTGASGDAVLVAGTVAVSIPGLTTASKVILTRHLANTVTLTVEYQYAVTANTLTITAAVAAGTINVADVSTITYAVIG